MFETKHMDWGTTNTDFNLSTTEMEILRYTKEGLTSSQIARIRNCSPRTIEKHRSNIIKKLGIKSSQYALLLWIHKNLHHFDT